MTDGIAEPIPYRTYFDETQAILDRKPRRFQIIPFDNVRLSTAPAYLVRGVLPRTGLVVVWGPPKCGKSYVVFDMLMHVALGWRYRGNRTVQGSVVYAALEGKRGFEARIEAFRQRRLADAAPGTPFFFCPITLNLIADHVALADEIALDAPRPSAIVIDTVNRSLAGSESDDKDMGAYIAAADSMAKRFNCLVLVVHHSGVDASRPRGHTSLAGAVDAQIAVKKDARGEIVATVELAKDFESGQAFRSRLVSVDVGIDDEGEPITSCVVERVDTDHGVAAADPKGRLKRKLPDSQRLSLDVLTTCCLDRGEPLPAAFGIPGSPRAVKIDVWRDELFARGALARDAKNPRDAFSRVKTGLLVKELAAEREGLIWIV